MEITNVSAKHYLLICEIGPVFDFVRHCRKTKDYWAASFLFSYFMAQVANRVEAEGAEVFLPYLKDNPMVTGKGNIDAGSVPDQLYFLLNAENKEKIRVLLKTVIKNIIDYLKPKIEEAIKEKERKTVFLNAGEVNEFFNFFYIIHPIKKDHPTHEEYYDEFIEAERKIRMRAAFRPFEQSTSSLPINKWEKCNLCGDRKKVHEIEKIDSDSTFLSVERICSVCLLKRYLPEAAKDINVNIIAPTGDYRYESTSDIALRPIKECIEKADEEIKNEYNKFINECKNESKDIDLSEGRYFYDPDFRNKFTGWKKKIVEKYPEKTELKWLNRPFYAIVYMDGDNMGDVLKQNANNFQPYISKVSKLLSKFLNGVNKIITDHCGQLIFAGGEDVIFVIHPEYLLDCINELQKEYNALFTKEELTKSMADKFTLSAGAIACYHKYPLSEAIRRAGVMLKDHAKKHKGKNATAISLIKGHTEALNLTFSNNSIGNLKKLKECLIKSDISRTTPYRITEHKELFEFITDADLRKNYLYTIIAGTRNPEKINPSIEEMVNLLMSFGDTETMIDALLFTRFMSGDR